jgi:hypothetical protein
MWLERGIPNTGKYSQKEKSKATKSNNFNNSKQHMRTTESTGESNHYDECTIKTTIIKLF